ncbi:hypothetical protein [Alteromonas sp. H39]|uniref:hypothetical protein n=1 Tax=Alteromonas sp. H39 TaxID=3389876 RepID=UPI0039E1C10B
MMSTSYVLMMAMGPVAAYLAGIIVFSGARAIVHRMTPSQPYSRRAFPSGQAG